MTYINHLVEMISNFMSGGVFVTIAMLLEMALRMLKTDKPMGIIHGISGFLKAISGLFGKVAELLDKVLPQKLN
jgi:hypothetical protein